MAGPAVSEEVARAWRQRQVEIDGCQNRTRLIGLLATKTPCRNHAVPPAFSFSCVRTMQRHLPLWRHGLAFSGALPCPSRGRAPYKSARIGIEQKKVPGFQNPGTLIFMDALARRRNPDYSSS